MDASSTTFALTDVSIDQSAGPSSASESLELKLDFVLRCLSTEILQDRGINYRFLLYFSE